MTSEYEGWSAVFAFCGSVVSVGVILVYLKDVLVPFVLAIFLAYLVRPFAEWISAHLCVCRRRMRTPKGIADSDAADETESLSLSRSAAARRWAICSSRRRRSGCRSGWAWCLR